MDSIMNDTVKINIKYRLKDFRDFSFAKSFMGVTNKILLIPAAVLGILMIMGLTFAIFLSFWDPYILVMIISPCIIAILFISAFLFLPVIVNYLVYKRSFMKSKALQGLNCLEFTREKYTISSADGMTSLKWEEIYMFQELRNLMILYLSPLKMTIIPKRCFESQEQIDELKDILRKCLPKNKLKLKNYKFERFSPDYGEVEFKNESCTVVEFDGDNVEDNPELTLDVSLEKKDLLSTYFILLYKKPAGIIITLVGLCLIILNVKNFEINSPSFFLLVLGITFVFLMPLMLIINSDRAYNNDQLIQKTVKYKIYKDYYMVNHPSGMSRTEFANLVKIVETRSAILLFVTTQICHIIPKRIFVGKEEELLKFKEILSEYRKKRH